MEADGSSALGDDSQRISDAEDVVEVGDIACKEVDERNCWLNMVDLVRKWEIGEVRMDVSLDGCD